MVEVTLEKVYQGELKFIIVSGCVSVTDNFQFTMVNFTLVNFHDYGRKNKDDPPKMSIQVEPQQEARCVADTGHITDNHRVNRLAKAKTLLS